jgi:SRSO17 transposase
VYQVKNVKKIEKKVASDKPLPELAEYLAPFHKYFVRSEGRESLERYSTGLLSDIPRKNGQTIEDNVPGTNYQKLQSLMTTIQWDEKGVQQERVGRMRDGVSLEDSVLIVDDTGNPKQGDHSVGVARQYCSELGKVANCQVVVTCHYADPATSWPVNAQLYLPKEWTDDPQRMQEAGVPEDVQFKTKPEIALTLLDEAVKLSIPHEAVVTDAGYGGDDPYLSGLEARGEHYVNAIPCDFTVILEGDPGAKVQRADAVMHQIPKRKWQTIRWREGTKGWLRRKFTAVRAYRVLAGERKTLGWLMGERPGYGQKGEWKYYFSDFPVDTPLKKLVDYVHRRWHVDRFYEDAKNELGWGDYQGRSWIGFHRHIIIVMLTYSFLAWREWKHRHSTPRSRGRPRNPFSPRRDRRRQSIQEIHRQVIDILWRMAVEYQLRN